MDPRDIAIRTILGEAANESAEGQAAVAHVLLNRAADPRWPSTIQDVALQPKQFSAWNKGAGGNNLVNKYGPGDNSYERVGAVYDQVASGQIADNTGGATHYYSPAGMQALVNEGSQSNLMPRWFDQQTEMRGAAPTTIGGHIFTGRADGIPATQPSAGMPPQVGEPQPSLADVLGGAEMGDSMANGLTGLGQMMMQQQSPPPPQIAPMQSAGYQPVKRDTSEPYLQLFQSLRG